MKVLVIEDAPEIRDILSEMLSMFGAEAVSVATGEEGISALSKDSFDVIFTDLRLPGIKGTELVIELEKAAGGTPIVVITGSPQDLNENEIRDRVFRIIRKPFPLSEISRVLQALR
ncbi:MAG: response regulator [Deltaproteobacteria bacterium]|nr:MAG: response regulator [Deltaproteobacteria bacterium]